MILKGITWNHSRGITPLLATAQRFNELHPGVQVQWHKRSLQQFANQPLEALTYEYDLLIIDHPWVGCAAATGCVLPLDEHLPHAYLQELAQHSVGASHNSYNYNNHQWALSIDAATPAASYRADLLQQAHTQVPTTWQQLLQLAQQGKVALPAIPIDTLMNFYTFCLAHGRPPFQNNKEVVDGHTGVKVLQSMRNLYNNIHPQFFNCNPIAVAEIMSNTNDYWYCPFAYNYSNYARSGYAKYILSYTQPVSYNGVLLRTTLGGTGIAVSTFSKHKEQAVAFVQMACSPQWQAGEYAYNGGQPGYDYAWKNENVNKICNNFFADTLSAIENAYVRPRYNGYLTFQDEAGDYVQEYLQHSIGNEEHVLDKLNRLYQKSIEKIIA